MKELSLHILDLTQNCITAGATLITLTVTEDAAADTLLISIEDNGCGMSEDFVARVTSPFTTTRTTRKVGLGIPLFKENAEMTGGSFEIRSVRGQGTCVTAVFGLSHIDRVPMGNLADTVLLLITGNPSLDFALRVTVNGEVFDFDTRQIREVLGDETPLDDPQIVAWMQDNLQSGLQELHGGM